MLSDRPDLIEAPADPKDRVAWRQELAVWREETRRQMGYVGANYSSPEFAWVPRCYSCNKVMTWDETFLDHRTGHFDVEGYLAEGERVFGGYDAVVLWHAYPRIGFDDRNQFDYYRDLPGGLEGVRDVVRRFHARGVRIYIDYNPWDVGTRREPASDAVALAQVVHAIDADGIFLDTLNQGGIDLRNEVDKVRKGVTFESELALPIEGLELNNASWGQWFDYGESPGVLRNRWFERRHMMHMIRRWDHDHANEMHLAWMNGAGMLVWENIFGSWNGWSAENQRLLREMLPIQRHFHRHFTEGIWTPLIATGVEGVYASEWNLDGVRLWTVVNRRDKAARGDWFETYSMGNERLFDLLTGEEINRPEGEIGPKGIAAILSVPMERMNEDLRSFLAAKRHEKPEASFDRRFHIGPVALPGKATVKEAPAGWMTVPAGTVTVADHFRVRECGERNYARFGDKAYPPLHTEVAEARKITFAAFALAPREVTNAEFAEFLHGTHYQPESDANFLKHWVNGAPPAGQEDHPVVYVNLRDARAYAKWKGYRLPTDAEWQSAMMAHHPERPHPVWNWTESEATDGRTRFSLLKGGSGYNAVGSGWYADGGVRQPNWSAKFIHLWDGLDRCPTIGFRCVT